jgi:hypothetical protein
MAVDGDLKKRGPYLFVVPYEIQGLTHEASVQVQCVTPPEPGTLPIDIELRTRNGVGRTLADMAATYWAIVKTFIPTEAVTSQYYLKRAQAGTDKLFYVSSGDLEDAASGGATALCRQETMVFRTALSSVVRFIFLESAFSAGDELVPLRANTGGVDTYEHFAAWVTAPISPVLGVDASWAVAPISRASTQNEAIYNARNRK